MWHRIVLIVPVAAALAVAAESDAAKRLGAAADVFSEIMDVADRAIPQKLLDKSECVVVVPGLKKGAFIIGAKFGRGFVFCRKEQAGWSAPGGVRVEGGSVGFQIGGSETDVVMLIMNERGAKRLLGTSKFTLGGDASAAAGPVGRTATAETDAMMTAEILTWSRARGLFAGVSLQGATMRGDQDANSELYGSKLLNKDIVLGDRAVPEASKKLHELLNKYSSRRAK